MHRLYNWHVICRDYTSCLCRGRDRSGTSEASTADSPTATVGSRAALIKKQENSCMMGRIFPYRRISSVPLALLWAQNSGAYMHWMEA